jgi:DNA-binding transcriptional MerR regulator
MSYTKQEVMERSGLADRTIRNYVKRGLLPAAKGHGLAAEYDEEHMVRAVAIGRMRADGDHVDVITERIAGWKTAQFKRFVAKTEPAAPEAPVEPQPSSPAKAPEPPLPAPAIDPEPALHEPSSLESARTLRRSARRDTIAGDELPDAPCWRIYSLITGIGLMVDVNAPPVVQRIAAEILGRYGPR